MIYILSALIVLQWLLLFYVAERLVREMNDIYDALTYALDTVLKVDIKVQDLDALQAADFKDTHKAIRELEGKINA